MGLCLGYESALRYWLTKQEGEAIPDVADTGLFAYAEANARLVRQEGLPVSPEVGRPLQLVIPHVAGKHRIDNTCVHVCQTELPEGSFRRLGGDALVSSPELTFLQMAVGKTLWETVELGCYLCSTFAISDRGRDYVCKRDQLVTLDDLRRYLDRLPPHTYGVRRARGALRYVVEATASPMEVQLAMHFGMPPDLGGRGPLAISANQIIQIDEHAQRLLDASYLRGDLFLPDYQSDLEFDSEAFHTGRFRLDHTQARRNVLEAMQVKTISATQGQIGTLKKFDDFVWLLEKRIGREHLEPTPRQRSLQVNLFAWLNDRRRTLF